MPSKKRKWCETNLEGNLENSKRRKINVEDLEELKVQHQ
jgi:hypothetical protein